MIILITIKLMIKKANLTYAWGQPDAAFATVQHSLLPIPLLAPAGAATAPSVQLTDGRLQQPVGSVMTPRCWLLVVAGWGQRRREPP